MLEKIYMGGQHDIRTNKGKDNVNLYPNLNSLILLVSTYHDVSDLKMITIKINAI